MAPQQEGGASAVTKWGNYSHQKGHLQSLGGATWITGVFNKLNNRVSTYNSRYFFYTSGI
jgi:hypothetical protein